jgi:hypothetical protein
MSEQRERYDAATSTWIDEYFDLRTNTWGADNRMPRLQSKDEYRALLAGLPKCVEMELHHLREQYRDDPDVTEALIRLPLDPLTRQRRIDKLAHAERVEEIRMGMLRREALTHGLVWNGSRWIDLDEAATGLPRGIPNRFRR